MRYYDTTKETAFQYLRRTIAEHNSDKCLEWPFYRNPKGYGMLVWPVTYRNVFAHRLAFFLANGHWPNPLGLHDCDNPACYNPRHIRAGTTRDNSDDMVARGRARHAKGSAVNTAILTEQQVADIKRRYVRGNGAALGREYGVSQCAISAIIVGRNWKHIEELEVPESTPSDLTAITTSR